MVWTTTPWTLVSNVAVAVNPDVTYVIAQTDGGIFVVAEPLLHKTLGEDVIVLDRLAGRLLERWTYQRPFDYFPIEDANYIVLADYVTTADGSGLVHQAPAFGADDLAVGRQYGLPVLNPVLANGHFGD